MVTFRTNLGDFKLELDADKAPKTVENFLSYCRDGFYNGTLFHRVIKDFVVQGGGFTEGMIQKPTKGSIRNEANNGLKNSRGTICMARTPDPHSASSQFFINLKDNAFLDFKSETPNGWGYCVFGKVVSGMEVIDQMPLKPTTMRQGHQDVPAEDIVVLEVILDEAGNTDA